MAEKVVFEEVSDAEPAQKRNFKRTRNRKNKQSWVGRHKGEIIVGLISALAAGYVGWKLRDPETIQYSYNNLELLYVMHVPYKMSDGTSQYLDLSWFDTNGNGITDHILVTNYAGYKHGSDLNQDGIISPGAEMVHFSENSKELTKMHPVENLAQNKSSGFDVALLLKSTTIGLGASFLYNKSKQAYTIFKPQVVDVTNTLKKGVISTLYNTSELVNKLV